MEMSKKQKKVVGKREARQELFHALDNRDYTYIQIKNILKSVEEVPVEFLKYVASIIKFYN